MIPSARAYFARHIEGVSLAGKRLSAATIAATLQHLCAFFPWLSRELSFLSAIKANDATCPTLTKQNRRTPSAARERSIAALEHIHRVFSLMPSATSVDKRKSARL